MIACTSNNASLLRASGSRPITKPSARCAIPNRAAVARPLLARRSASLTGGLVGMKTAMYVRPRLAVQQASVKVFASDAVSVPEPQKEKSAFKVVTELFSNLFPVWTLLGAGVALKSPATFNFMTTDYFTLGLSILMFSMGITMTIKDFKDCLKQPGPIAVNFLLCYVMMPILALGISKAFGLSSGLLAGCVLIGSINGGQASNLCAHIAKGDVALSIIMTTATTVGVIFMTPLIAQLVLGTVVPVDAVGIVISTLQVVAAPVILGMTANAVAPDICKAVTPICPVVGVVATVVLVGASVAKCSTEILAAGWSLQFPLAILHLVGGLVGYFLSKKLGYTEKTSRTMAIETSMKSSAFGFLLASLHFSDFMVRVPCAVSVVWMAVVGSTMSVVWRFIPIVEDEQEPASA